MALTREQQRQQAILNHNAAKLEIIQALVLSLRVENEAARKKLEKYIADCQSYLLSREILLSLNEGEESLINLLNEQLVNPNDAQFKTKLAKWADNYKMLEQQATAGMRNLTQEQPRGITRSLVELGTVEDDAWGDDADVRIILKGVITDPEQVKASGTYVLPPISIVPGVNASEEEKIAPHAFLKNSIKTVLDNNQDKEIKLLIPIVSDQSHWRVANVTLNQGKIEHAILWDAVANATLSETPAFKNMQKAVTELDKPAVVTPDSVGIQKNDNDCMGYTVQKILQELPVVNDSGLVAIRDARTPRLRGAVISKIIVNSPTLTEKNQQLDSEIKNIFKNPIHPLENIEDRLHSSLSKISDNEKTAKEVKDFQVKFDAIMAKKLDELYKKESNAADDVLVKKARDYAFKELKKTLGFFPPKTEAVEKTPVAKKKLKIA